MGVTLIQLILHENNPLGVRTAESPGNSLRAVVVPRALWKEVSNLPELKKAGVYFLLSDQSNDGSLDVYIGEAENIWDRVSTHVSKQEKDFWSFVVCFVSVDGSLHKTHAKVLESCLCRLAKNLGRARLHNSNNPRTPNVPAADSITSMKFLEQIQLLLPTLGFPIFSPLHQKQLQYSCTGPAASAKGVYTEEGFIVLKGSLIRKDWAKHVDRERPKRERMIEEGVLEAASKDSYRFTRDYKFSHPSPAAVMVLARSANGWDKWIDAKGRTLHENVRVKVI